MSSQDEAVHKEALPIGGWLILVAIGTIITPFKLLYFVGTIYPPIFTDGTWEALTTVGSQAYSPFWAPLIIGEIAANVLLLVLSAYFVYLFFSKKASVPFWYFGLALFSCIFIVIDAYLVTFILPEVEMFDAETLGELARSLFALLIWSPYLFLSQRSKDTFIYKGNQQAA